MTRRQWLGLSVAVVVSCAATLGAGAVLLVPDLSADLVPVASLDDRGTDVRAERKRPTKKRAGKPKRPPTRAKPKPRERLEPDVRAEVRVGEREERLLDTNERLDRYAAEAGWDEATTEEIRVILIDTADLISDTIARVDLGESTWEDVRDELRTYRLDQADAVKAVIGEEAFPAFTEGMGFDRFVGDELLPPRTASRPRRGQSHP